MSPFDNTSWRIVPQQPRHLPAAGLFTVASYENSQQLKSLH